MPPRNADPTSLPKSRGRWGAAHADELPTVWGVSVSRLSRLLQDVAPEFDAGMRFENINLGFEEATRLIRQRSAAEHCDVVVAAGSNGAYLKSRIEQPVVLVRPSGFDLMQALTRARKLSPRIAVISHETDLPIFGEFQRSFRMKIEQRAFVTEEEARGCVAELIAGGTEVIVGTGLVADLAEQAGVAGVLMYTADSVRQAFEQAIDLSRHLGNAGRLQRPARRALRSQRYTVSNLVGGSQAMQDLRARVGRLGSSDATVLISGSTGTGKELVAQAIHAASPRKSGPLIAVNCGAIAESLFESEMFGYEEGAFTGSRRGGHHGLVEAADGGSLFLDEIGEMPSALQTRLLRVLEERQVMRVGASSALPVDIRVIAATHCDLGELVAQGRFRQDLYYRINVLRLRVPDLAERSEDIEELLKAMLQRQFNAPVQVRAEALALLRRYPWPGNVRELRNIVERLPLALAGTSPYVVDRQALAECAPELLVRAAGKTPVPKPDAIEASARPDRRTLLGALSRAKGNRAMVAAQFGVSRTTLWRWLRES